MNRKLLGAALLAAVVLAPAQPVFAHGGNGGASSDYRIEVTGFEGDHSGIEIRPVELGNRMELVRATRIQLPACLVLWRQLRTPEAFPCHRNNDCAYERLPT